MPCGRAFALLALLQKNIQYIVCLGLTKTLYSLYTVICCVKKRRCEVLPAKIGKTLCILAIKNFYTRYCAKGIDNTQYM